MADFQVNERLEFLIRKVFNTNPTAFSRAYNDNRGVKTNQVIRKRNGLSSNLLDEICKAYPIINRSWLLTGEGEPLKDETSSRQSNEIDDTNIPDIVGMNKYVYCLLKNCTETIRKQQDTINELTKKIHSNEIQ